MQASRIILDSSLSVLLLTCMAQAGELTVIPSPWYFNHGQLGGRDRTVDTFLLNALSTFVEDTLLSHYDSETDYFHNDTTLTADWIPFPRISGDSVVGLEHNQVFCAVSCGVCVSTFVGVFARDSNIWEPVWHTITDEGSYGPVVDYVWLGEAFSTFPAFYVQSYGGLIPSHSMLLYRWTGQHGELVSATGFDPDHMGGQSPKAVDLNGDNIREISTYTLPFRGAPYELVWQYDVESGIFMVNDSLSTGRTR